MSGWPQDDAESAAFSPRDDDDDDDDSVMSLTPSEVEEEEAARREEWKKHLAEKSKVWQPHALAEC